MPSGVVSIIPFPSENVQEFLLAPTHALVSFDDDNITSVVPVKLISGAKGDRKVEKGL